MNKYSKGWKEMRAIQSRISTGADIIRLVSKGIEVESGILQKKYPLCAVCRERKTPDQGSYDDEGKFICVHCQADIYS